MRFALLLSLSLFACSHKAKPAAAPAAPAAEAAPAAAAPAAEPAADSDKKATPPKKTSGDPDEGGQ
jgi:hypothetical protein